MKNKKNCMFFGLDEKMTDEQQIYRNAIMSKSRGGLVMCDARAGSGKTTIAVACAKLLVSSKQFDQLVYIFSPVEEQTLGFTPGTVTEKEEKYIGPLLDALNVIDENTQRCFIRDDDAAYMKLNKDYAWIKATSHTFLRGRNIQKSIVIIDEAQNFTVSELQKTLTRIHDDCLVIVIGHKYQCDIKNMSGFGLFIEHARDNFPGVSICTLTKSFRGKLSEWADEIVTFQRNILSDDNRRLGDIPNVIEIIESDYDQ